MEATYETDLATSEAIHDAIFAHCERLASRLRRAGMAGHTVTLKLRFADFTTVTRSMSQAEPISHTPELWDAARSLLARIEIAGRGVRLLGVGASGLVAGSDPRQLSLEHPQRTAAADAADAVRARFGDDAVLPARLVTPPDEG